MNNIHSTIATPLAIVGFGSGAIGYVAKASPQGMGFAIAYTLMLLGMMKELKEESGFEPDSINFFSIGGNIFAGMMFLFLIKTSAIAKVAAAGFLTCGLSQAFLYFKKDNAKNYRKVERVLSVIGATLLLTYYISSSNDLLNQHVMTSMMFASTMLLSLYYGITLGLLVDPSV